MNTDLVFGAVCTVVVLTMLIYYMRRERKILSFVFGAFTGMTALFILNRYGGAIGAEIPLNIFNVGGSAVLGVPFVAGLVVLKYL
ncbi:MAG: pro-sigmaK processing inhibitor BofA family protein [Ruminococcus flavefaciens]|nr:pro-sigmaK processing inhibitor BofA family protein [Ruminococcus flavefaciens]